MDIRRLLPLSGVAFVVIALGAILVTGLDPPASGAPSAEVLDYYQDHEVREFIGSFVFAASVPFLVFFAVTLAAAWSEGADRRAVWEYVLIGGAVLTGGILLMVIAIHFALVDAANQEDVSAEAAQAINVLDGSTWVAFNAGFGVMMLGAAGCALRRARPVVPVWLGWAALVLGIALFIPFADFIALILTLLWIIVVSVMLFRRSAALSA